METPPVERNGNTSISGGGECDTAPCVLSTVAEVSTTTDTSSITERQLPDQTEETPASAALQVINLHAYLVRTRVCLF